MSFMVENGFFVGAGNHHGFELMFKWMRFVVLKRMVLRRLLMGNEEMLRRWSGKVSEWLPATYRAIFKTYNESDKVILCFENGWKRPKCGKIRNSKIGNSLCMASSPQGTPTPLFSFIYRCFQRFRPLRLVHFPQK